MLSGAILPQEHDADVRMASNEKIEIRQNSVSGEKNCEKLRKTCDTLRKTAKKWRKTYFDLIKTFHNKQFKYSRADPSFKREPANA